MGLGDKACSRTSRKDGDIGGKGSDMSHPVNDFIRAQRGKNISDVIYRQNNAGIIRRHTLSIQPQRQIRRQQAVNAVQVKLCRWKNAVSGEAKARKDFKYSSIPCMFGPFWLGKNISYWAPAFSA